jgi:virginiamycin B lyase
LTSIKRGSSFRTSKKSKTLIFAIILIVGVIITLSAVWAFRNANNTSNPNYKNPATAAELIAASKRQSVENYQKQFCGIGTRPNSNSYITEYILPSNCEMPLGVAVDIDSNNNSSNTAADSGKVWYVSTKDGTLGSFDIKQNKFAQEQLIPIWKSRGNPTDSSQVWDVKVDGHGNVWFTDEKQNAIWKFNPFSKQFEMYNVPAKSNAFGTTYPVSLDFDANENIYFVGIRSPTLWYGETNKMKNGTSDGISKIPIPLGEFKGIDPNLVSVGSLAVDVRNNVVWISLLAFNTKGEISRYDIDNKTFDTFDMPRDISSPVGIAVDYSGDVWATDHATSLFFKLDHNTRNITKFSTSGASPRIFGGNSTPETAYTLPYWIKTNNNAAEGSLWFNEHAGNKIARFIPSNMTLIEYWIPTQDRQWGLCPPPQATAKDCGIANALQLSAGGKNNQEIWFTEWSENKIGRLNGEESLPLLVSIPNVQSPGTTIKKGQPTEIKVDLKAFSNNITNINMLSAGPFTQNGVLGNSTGVFSEQSFAIKPGESKQISFIFTPAADLKSGQYMLMVGADTGPVSILRAVKINVI